MDINLPEISGVDALTLQHDDASTAHIPTVALISNSKPQNIEFGMKVGFFRYVTKPFSVNELMETVDLALAHSGGTKESLHD